jgi:hypothetical protein
MKYEEYEAKYLIKYTPGDIESMRTAMNEYAGLVESGDAFQDDYIVAHFQPDVEKIDISFFEEHPHLITFLEESCTYYNKERDNIIESTFTETLFFLCAVKHPELKADLQKACESIVKFARKTNDSSAMWNSSEYPFGVEPLQIVSTVYPEYGYLFAGFFVPNWDDEHMFESLGALADWSNRIGISEDTIKAFCYCDNHLAREMMLGYTSWNGMSEDMFIDTKFPLVNYLRDEEDRTPLEYSSNKAMNRFKQQLVERFRNQPLIQDVELTCCEDKVSVTDPITIIVLEMLLSVKPCETWEADFDIDEFLTERLVHKSAILEIEEIHEQLQKEGIALNAPDYEYQYQSEEEPEDSEEDQEKQSVKNWQEFFLKVVSKGSGIWEYILNGSQSEVLNEIEEVDIIKLARKNKCGLYDELPMQCYSMVCFNEDMDKYLALLFAGFHNPNTRAEMGTIDDGKTLILRFADVIYRLCGNKPFDEDFINYVCDTYNVASSAEEFVARFPVDWKALFKEHTRQMSGHYSTISFIELGKITDLINQNREEAIEYLEGNCFNINTSNNISNELSGISIGFSPNEKLCIAIYLLRVDECDGREDKLTDLAKAYIEHYGEICLEFHLQDEMKAIFHYAEEHMSEEEKERQRAWLEVKSYLEKGVLKSNPQLQEEEVFEYASELLQKYMDKEERTPVSEHQECFDWFRINDYTQKTLLFAHMVVEHKDFACSSIAHRLLKLAYQLAPIRVAHIIAKAYNNDKKFESEMAMMCSLDMIKAQGMPEEAYLGYQLYQYIKTEGMDDPARFIGMLKELFEAIRKGNTSNNKLVLAFEWLKFETQLEIINFAYEKIGGEWFHDIYSTYFIKRFQRMLMSGYVLVDPPIYFYRKLEHQGYYQRYINWTEWGKNKVLLRRLLTEVETNIPCALSEAECRSKIYDTKGWGYLVLQKQGDKLVPVLGAERLSLLQKGFDEESMKQSHTHAIIIDEGCPKENIDELKHLLSVDHKAHIVSAVSSYLKGETALENVENFLRCASEYDGYMVFTNYYEYELTEVFPKLSKESQVLALNAMALVAPAFLTQISHKQTKSGFYNQLMDTGVDRYVIFKYLVSSKDWSLISCMAVATDISDFIRREKVQEIIDLLSIVSNYPQYHELVLSYKNSKVPKLKKHVKMLIEKHEIK